jgi:hypothetical protein
MQGLECRYEGYSRYKEGVATRATSEGRPGESRLGERRLMQNYITSIKV